MAAYVITDVEITDAPLYREFMEKVTLTVEHHGGKFVARGGALETVMGNWNPPRLAIMEFGSLDQIHTWLDSTEFKALNDIMTRSSNINMVIVDGL